MNGKNRHNKYRKRVYRKRNISVILIISAICLAVFLAAFLVIGNMLKAQSDKRNEPNENDTEASQSNEQTVEKIPIKSILGYSVFLETKESGNFADRLDALKSKGIYEASIPLNTSEGELLFKSSVANKISYPEGEANVTLDNAASSAKTRNMYISGIFYVNAFNNDDALVRSVELSQTAAIVAEALLAGFDDVVLVAPHMTEANIEEAIRFVENIKALTDGGCVGLCVSESILTLDPSQQTPEIIDRLDGRIDFLAVDLSLTDVSDGTAALGDAINPYQHYILMYKMRVLLPNGESDETLAAIISEAESNGIKNIQILP